MTFRLSALAGVVAVVLPACFALQETDVSDHVGAIGFNLMLPGGMNSGDLSYTVVGPGSYQKVGKVALGAQDRSFSAVISNIPVGTGYQLQVGADDTKMRCEGEAAFEIKPEATTQVGVNVQCHLSKDRQPGHEPDPDPTPAPDAGMGDDEPDDGKNLCPEIDGLYTWREANGTFEFSSSACDPDSSPEPLRYTWSVSAGKLLSSDKDVVRFVCPEEGGDVKVTLQVSDSLCSVAKTAQINCDCDTDQTQSDRRRTKQKP